MRGVSASESCVTAWDTNQQCVFCSEREAAFTGEGQEYRNFSPSPTFKKFCFKTELRNIVLEL